MAVTEIAPRAPLTEKDARKLTEKIKSSAEKTWALLLEARDRRAWDPLGYSSFDDYCRDEFGIGRSQAYRLISQAEVIGELTAAAGLSPAGDSVTISDRAARDIKPALPAVVNEVRERTKGRPRTARPAIAAAVVEEAREKLAEPEPPPTATKVTNVDMSDVDRDRLIDGVAKWAASSGVSFAVAVDRILGRLQPPTSGTRPRQAPAAQVKGSVRVAVDCPHPIGRRLGNTCMACHQTVK